MSFKDSLKAGKKGEQIVCEFLTSKNILFSLNTSNKLKELTGWDVKLTLNEEEITIEVKFDLMASKTGNMAIEFYNSKLCKPSGIAATRAKLWAVVLNGEAFICSVARLKAFLKDNKPLKNISSGGDNNASLYIYKLKNILPIFRLLNSDVTEAWLLEEANWKPQ